MEKRQLRTIFLYEFKLGHKAAEASHNINKAFGERTTNERMIQRWFKKFLKGNETLEDGEGRGRKTATENDKLKALVEANSRTTIRELAEEIGVCNGTISNQMREIGKTKKLDKWIPHELNENHKMHRFEIASSLILRYNNNPFIDRIVTCDEKWIMYHNQDRSAQWLGHD